MSVPVYKPEALSRHAPSESAELYSTARLYLGMGDEDLDTGVLTEIGDELTKSREPEYRFYGAWAYLEAAYPGLFGFDDAPTGTKDIDIDVVTKKAFDTLGALSRRTPYAVGGPTTLRPAYSDMYFGMKAQLVHNLQPAFESPKKADPNNGAVAVAEAYTKTARLLRRQDIALANSQRDMSGWPMRAVKDTDYAEALVRGLEVENRLLGLGWTHAANVQKATDAKAKHGKKQGSLIKPTGDDAEGVLLLPSSPRHDYGIARDTIAAVDVFAVDPHTESTIGIPIKRDAFTSRRKKMPDMHPRILHFYGDRDLGLQALLTKQHYNPREFKEFDADLARRTVYRIRQKFGEVDASTPADK
jgi:hypothetical protein